MTKHTDTPWKFNPFKLTVVSKKDGTICMMEGDEGVLEANAAFIVMACNAHDELVEALRYMKLSNDSGHLVDHDDPYHATINAALAKVKP